PAAGNRLRPQRLPSPGVPFARRGAGGEARPASHPNRPSATGRASILTGHTFNSAVCVVGSYPEPVRILTGVLAKLKLANTVPMGERGVDFTLMVMLPRRLLTRARPPSLRPQACTFCGLTSRYSSGAKYSMPAERPVCVRVW